MRYFIQFAVILWLVPVVFACSRSAKGIKMIEEEVKKLDIEHAKAVLSGNLQAMDKYWTEDFIVNNPFNEIDRADRIRKGTLTYSSFTREPEAIKVHNNTVITMGKEIVVPGGNSPDAGKTIQRRYTNIWMKRGSKWRLVARHASVICSP